MYIILSRILLKVFWHHLTVEGILHIKIWPELASHKEVSAFVHPDGLHTGLISIIQRPRGRKIHPVWVLYNSPPDNCWCSCHLWSRRSLLLEADQILSGKILDWLPPENWRSGHRYCRQTLTREWLEKEVLMRWILFCPSYWRCGDWFAARVILYRFTLRLRSKKGRKLFIFILAPDFTRAGIREL